jgi:hypothetical protein
MRYLKAIAVLALLSLAFIACASAEPAINGVTVYKNNQYIGTCGSYKVSVGNNIMVQVCCKNTGTACAATLYFTWIDGKRYTRTIQKGATNQCEKFYFTINSRMTSPQRIKLIQILSNCNGAGSGNYDCRASFYTS